MDAQALRLTTGAPVLTFGRPRTAVGRSAKESIRTTDRLAQPPGTDPPIRAERLSNPGWGAAGALPGRVTSALGAIDRIPGQSAPTEALRIKRRSFPIAGGRIVDSTASQSQLGPIVRVGAAFRGNGFACSFGVQRTSAASRGCGRGVAWLAPPQRPRDLFQ